MGGYDDFSKPSHDFFEAQYSKGDPYWGDQPNLLVPLVAGYLQPHSRILVVGCGEGRDALFLARIGFDVVATEIAESGLKRAGEAIRKNGVKLQLLNIDAHDGHEHLGKFDAVIMMNVLQFLDPERISERIAHFQSLVQSRGFMAAQVFTTGDPEYLERLEKGEIQTGDLVVEHHERKYKIRFFDRAELSSYFDGWEMIYYHEGIVWDKPHGAQTDFHQHGLAQMIARKKS